MLLCVNGIYIDKIYILSVLDTLLIRIESVFKTLAYAFYITGAVFAVIGN